MKRRYIFVAIALVLSVALVGCKGEPEHDHSYGEGKVSTMATSEHEGVITYTCSCGATKTEKIPALGHALESKDTSTTYKASYKDLIRQIPDDLGFAENDNSDDLGILVLDIGDSLLKSGLSIVDTEGNSVFALFGGMSWEKRTIEVNGVFNGYEYKEEKLDGKISFKLDASKVDESNTSPDMMFTVDLIWGEEKYDSIEKLSKAQKPCIELLNDMAGKLLAQGIRVEGAFGKLYVQLEGFSILSAASTKLEGSLSIELNPVKLGESSYQGKLSITLDLNGKYSYVSGAYEGIMDSIELSSLSGSFLVDCDLQTSGKIGTHEICFGIEGNDINITPEEEPDFTDNDVWKLALRIDGDMVAVYQLFGELLN